MVNVLKLYNGYQLGIFAMVIMVCLLLWFPQSALALTEAEEKLLDKRVTEFLANNPQVGGGMSSSDVNAKALYDMIMQYGYTKGLEIGTFRGHGAIHMAWALAKTGGTLITIEYDKENYERSKKAIEEAGLSPYVRLYHANAHDLVPTLVKDGNTFDIVFSDADKDWYIQYFKDLISATEIGGRHVADNTFASFWNSKSYRDFVDAQSGSKTTHYPSRSTSVSLKVH